MKWFETVFLPSLFDRAKKSGGRMWLTEKQSNICKRYMVACKTMRGLYFTTWDDRYVSIQISSKNGCGCIEFCLATNTELEKIEEERIKNDDIKWLQGMISDLESYITENPDKADSEDFEDLEKYKKELATLTA